MKTREYRTVDAPTVHHMQPIEINLLRQGWKIVKKDYVHLKIEVARDIMYTLKSIRKEVV